MESSVPCPLFILAGATATGKTALAVKIAARIGGEIVGADSVQVYRRADIGSAKPAAEELCGVPHHLVDVADLDEAYDAGRYVTDADHAIEAIRARGRIPIVAGGTGLYLRALVRGLADGIPSDPTIRARLNAEAARGPAELASMHRALAERDPVYAAKIHPSDPIRIVRALEVLEVSGEPISAHHARHAAQPDRYHTLFVALEADRTLIRERIATRTRRMFADGWVDEVRSILADGFAPSLKPLRSVGYAQVIEHVQRGTPTDEALEAVRSATVAFAKRQRTWFRGERNVTWVAPEDLLRDDWLARIQAHMARGPA